MSETIIISNLHKDDFVASANSSLSLANHIKLAILNLPPAPGEPEYAHNISHYSELAFLSRIIVIFKSSTAAASAYEFLASLQNSADSTHSMDSTGISQRFSLPSTAKLSLQENLLSHSRSFDDLGESSELSVRDDLERFRSRHSGEFSDYEEPAPEKLDMYQDLLKCGIDISKFNSEAEVKEFEENSKRVDSDPFSRRKSVTKTLFKPTPTLSVNTDSKAVGHLPPPSPIITLDETF